MDLPKSLIQIWEILQKYYMFQSVSLLQNSEIFPNMTCTQNGFASKQGNVQKWNKEYSKI